MRSYLRPGTFRDVADVVSNAGLNMRSAQTKAAKDGRPAAILLTLEVSRSEELVRVLDRLERLKNVDAVRRVDK